MMYNPAWALVHDVKQKEVTRADSKVIIRNTAVARPLGGNV